MSLNVNGIEVASMGWSAGWSGPWVATVEISGEVVPSGRVVITSTEGITAVGTVDKAHSGSFGEKRFARVVGGGGGWGKSVRAQHYHSDIGVNLIEVVTTTATEVGEVAAVLLPKMLGTDFARLGENEPASQVFARAGVDWWVGLDGVTKVGIRPPLPPHPSLEVLDWRPEDAAMTFSAAVLVEPGTVLVDARFGTKIVRYVDAMVARGSVTGTLLVADASPDPGGVTTELVAALSSLARGATRAALGRLYEYRVIAMAGDRVELQAVRRDDGAPDLLPASVWAGISGYRATLQPASRVLVGFIAGDATKPYVAAYEPPEGDGWRPLRLELDAEANVTLGERAATVVVGLAAAARPVARVTPSFAAWVTAVTAVVNSVTPGAATPPVDIASSKMVAS